MLYHFQQSRMLPNRLVPEVGALSTKYFWYWPSVISPIALDQDSVTIIDDEVVPVAAQMT